MDIYDNIVEGLNEHKSVSLKTEDYLRSLQPSVRLLRQSYYSYPVCVPYNKQEIQASYLIAYLPHYYQLIYSILNNDSGELFKNKEKINLGFIGGGPGSEVYGALKFIINNGNGIKHVNVTVYDINAEKWKFSHGIVLKNLIGSILGSEKQEINWNSVQFNLVSEIDVNNNLASFKSLDLLVIQNCINEIAKKDIPILKNNIVKLFQLLPPNAYLLISDLTSGVRSLLKDIEADLVKTGCINFKVSTLGQSNPTSIISVHHQPNRIIRENLMTGADGLIPRKNLNYDYSLLSRMKVEKKLDSEAIGFNSLYAPLGNNQIDANNFVHTKSFIGLDFGTSTSVVSCATLANDQLNIKSIPIPQKDKENHITVDPLVPTVMCLVGNIFMVGKYAFERKSIMEFGKDIWYGFKQNLLDLNSIQYENSILKNHHQIKISNAKEALVIFFKYLNKEVLAHLKNKNLPLDVEYSVTVPAGFDFERKQIIRQCLIEAGIPYFDTPFLDEPTAALINYLYESKDPVNLSEKLQNVLILDIGAGTVDISIMQLEKQIEGVSSKLLSVAREGFIGGNLLDEMIARKLLKGKKDLDLLTIIEKSEILKKCENLKIKLCKALETDSTVDFKLDDLAFGSVAVESGDLKIQFCEFYDLMIQYWDNIKKTIGNALKKASFSKDDINTLILNGGGSRNPYIQSFTRDLFDQSKIVRPDNIQEHVSKGAALNSFVLNSYGKQIVANMLNNPVSISDGHNMIQVIPSGVTLPTFEVELFPGISYSSENKQLTIIHNDQVAFFLIPPNIHIDSLIVSINIDNDPECEIVTTNGTIKAKRSIFNNAIKPFKIKPL